MKYRLMYHALLFSASPISWPGDRTLNVTVIQVCYRFVQASWYGVWEQWGSWKFTIWFALRTGSIARFGDYDGNIERVEVLCVAQRRNTENDDMFWLFFPIISKKYFHMAFIRSFKNKSLTNYGFKNLLYMFFFRNRLFIFICWCVHAHMPWYACTHMPTCTCGGQETAYQRQFSPSVWDSEFKMRFLFLVVIALTHS